MFMNLMLPKNFLMLAPDGGAGAGAGGGDGTGGASGAGQGAPEGGTPGTQERTFTQAEVNAMMAREKNQGRASVLNELGIEDNGNLKESLAGYKQWVASQKTDLQKAQESLATERTAKETAQSELQKANNKLAAIQAGVNAKYVDDVVALATARVTDKKDFATVLTEMKTTHPMFYGNGEEGVGTGGLPNGGKGTKSQGDLGKRLAEAHKGKSTQSSFFK